MSGASETKQDVTAYHEKHVAPNYKRRQLIFDSFSKLQHGTTTRNAKGNGPKGGTLLYSWGAGYHGQLGNEAKRKKCEMIPVQINFNEPVISISCGGFHTAVVTEKGEVFTWGDGRFGQLGNLERKYNMQPTPQLVERLVSDYRATIVDLSCGQYHTACVSAKGELFTWGSAKYGQIGMGGKTEERYPQRVVDRTIGSFKKVACGDKHTVCLSTSKKVVTFGSGQHGQLGHGGEQQNQKRNAGAGLDEYKPKLVQDMLNKDVKWIAAGATVTAAVTESGEMWLWGFGESIHPKGRPNIVYNPSRVDFFAEKGEVCTQVGIGQSHIVVLTESGDVWAFGNLYIKRSVSASEAAVANVRTPRLLLKRENVQQIACGRYHTMVLTDAGILYSWGIGESGQLGHNRLQSNEFPQILEWIMPNVVGRVACGDHHSFCLSSIRFHEIHPEIKRWKKLQDQLLQRKKEIRRTRKELSEGLRTKQILEIDRERDQMVSRDKNEQEEQEKQQKKLLRVQLESIQMRSEIEDMVKSLKEAKKRVKKIKAREEEEQAEKRRSNKKKGAGKRKPQQYSAISGRSTTDKGDAEDMPFQPLMPRIGFMETTQKSLMEVKKQTESYKSSGSSVVKPDIKKYMRELFEHKKIFNRLCETNKNLHAKQAVIAKELTFLKPTDEDIQQKALNDKILDDLKMKLVTKDTQLMETEENKSNYNLYIIRMKEENLVISKSIDHLRQMKREYDRLIAKLNKVCVRVNGQRSQIQDEIGNFSKDIRGFTTFAGEQLSRYRQMINSTAKAKKQQKASQAEREAKMNNRKKRKMRKLMLEHKDKEKEAARFQNEKVVMEKKVDYYAQRFRKISEATGLKEPEDIIAKFFSNDHIAEDLRKDIQEKQEKEKVLAKDKEKIVKDLAEKKASFKVSKWRDITSQEENMQEDSKRVKKLVTEVSGINNRMLVIKEGINSLLAGVQMVTGEEEDINENIEKALEQLREKVGKAWDVSKKHMQAMAKKKAESKSQ